MYVAESKRLTHQGAKKIMTTAVDVANQAGIAISCAIVDAGGHMMLLERMDGGRFHTVYSCTTRAVCAASNRRPTTAKGAAGQDLERQPCDRSCARRRTGAMDGHGRWCAGAD